MSDVGRRKSARIAAQNRKKPSSKKTQRSPKQKHFPPILIRPTYNRTTREYEWPDFEIKKVPNKHNIQGLFAKHRLEPNTQFPYYGRIINDKEYKKLLSERKAGNPIARKRLEYTSDCPGLKANCIVDASPTYQPTKQKVGGRGKFIGAKVNEPAVGETENAWLTSIRDKDGKIWPGLVIVTPVKAGQEILTHYGPDYYRIYPVGKPTTKEPAWFNPAI